MNDVMRQETKKELDPEVFVFLVFIIGLFYPICAVMGVSNMLNTLMNTAYSSLINTVLYILAIAVVTGAISSLLSEFGIVALLNKLLSPLMNPLFGLPGAAALGIVTTYLSDNPAILPLAEDKNFRRYFKKYQFPALTNLGTAFGMGLIVSTFMLSLNQIAGENLVPAILVGNLGAVIGSIVSTRLMLRSTVKIYGKDEPCEINMPQNVDRPEENVRNVRSGSVGLRAIGALLDGGKSGVDLGLGIIPGVLIVCTLVLMLTNGPADSGIYTGAAYEGVAILPWLADKLNFILKPLFGFTSPQAIAVPITALGAAGASLGLVPPLLTGGFIGANDIAVFTAMCMCWSGYLSTHVSMMQSLNCKNLIGSALISHTIGGICAGISANLLFRFLQIM